MYWDVSAILQSLEAGEMSLYCTSVSFAYGSSPKPWGNTFSHIPPFKHVWELTYLGCKIQKPLNGTEDKLFDSNYLRIRLFGFFLLSKSWNCSNFFYFIKYSNNVGGGIPDNTVITRNDGLLLQANFHLLWSSGSVLYIKSHSVSFFPQY